MSDSYEFAKNMRISRHVKEMSTTARPAIKDPAAYGAACEKHVRVVEEACLDKGSSPLKCDAASARISACYQVENDAIETATIHGGAGVTKLGNGFGSGITIDGKTLDQQVMSASRADSDNDRAKVWDGAKQDYVAWSDEKQAYV